MQSATVYDKFIIHLCNSKISIFSKYSTVSYVALYCKSKKKQKNRDVLCDR